MSFDWDTSEMSILMLAKLSVGTARIVINNLHIKGEVCKNSFLLDLRFSVMKRKKL